MDSSFISQQNKFIESFLNIDSNYFNAEFENFKNNIINRCNTEINYWEDEILNIKNLSKDQAIDMLIKALKINEKINSINSYINNIRGRNGY